MARRAAPSLFAIARKRLADLHVQDAEREGRSLAAEPLRDYIPRLSPGYESPDHLAPLLALLERVKRGEEVRAVVDAPPRHAKTETILAGFSWLLGGDPAKVHGYATYEANLSKSKSRIARSYAQAAGVKFLDDRPGRLAEWHTAAGGGLLATSVGGPLTGQGVTGLMVIDDPFKNRLEAESKAKRESHWKWVTDVAYTRLEPGASLIVTQARWHEDDPAGRALKLGFEHVHLPAISPDGKALWPSRRPLAYLRGIEKVLGPYSWSSLYLGAPRGREGRVFKDVVLGRPPAGVPLKIAIGVDLAYSEDTKADWSVAVVLGRAGSKAHVLEVLREQVEAPVFAGMLRKLCVRYPGARPRWYASGTEKGSGQFIRKLGVPLVVVPARGDKFIRAQPAAAAWNAGNIVVPGEETTPAGIITGEAPAWADGFVARVCDFTGEEGELDDEVDALAPAYDVLFPERLEVPKAPGGGLRVPVLDRVVEEV